MIFLTHLDTRYIGGGYFELLAPLDVKIGGQVLRIPKGFITDFASIPKLARWLIAKTEDHIKGAVLHDYLYSLRGRISFIGIGKRTENISRKQSDKLFLVGMKVCKASLWKRFLMHSAVRLFGWYRWNKKTV